MEEQQLEIDAPAPTPQVVGNAFVQQYYHILHQSPELVFRFYQESSQIGRHDDTGAMGSVSTLQAIKNKILSLNSGDFGAEIKSVDTQDSQDGAVLVLVTGYLTGKDNVKRNFTQTFFLAPQHKGYYVLNDIFRYIEDSNPETSYDGLVEAHFTSDEDPFVAKVPHVLEQMSASSEEFSGKKIYNPSENEKVLASEDVPVPKVNEIQDDNPSKNEEVLASKEEPVPKVNESQDDSIIVTESNSKIVDVPKKSYASMVMKERSAPFSYMVSTPPRHISKSSVTLPSSIALPKATTLTSNASENVNTQDGEAIGNSIYLKGLPMNATIQILEPEFKKFGAIKSNGIQVRSNNVNGFCFGFIEFDESSAVQRAIKGSPVTIDGCQVIIKEKRYNSRGYNRGRFTNGGEVGNEGFRYRGNNGGGRGGYIQSDFNSKRRGYQNHGCDNHKNCSDNGYHIRGVNGYQTRGGNRYQTRGGNETYRRGADGNDILTNHAPSKTNDLHLPSAPLN